MIMDLLQVGKVVETKVATRQQTELATQATENCLQFCFIVAGDCTNSSGEGLRGE